MSIKIRLHTDFRPGSPTVFGSTTVTWNCEGFATVAGSVDLPDDLAKWARKFPRKYEVVGDGSPPPVAPNAPPAIILPAASLAEAAPQGAAATPAEDASKPFEDRFEEALQVISRNKQRAAARVRNVLDTLKISGAGSSYQELVGALKDAFTNAGAAGRRAIVQAVEAEAGGGATQ